MTKSIVIQEIKRGYNGFFKIDEMIFRHSLFQGGETPDIQREVFGRGQAAVVLLYDRAHKMVALIEQCRAGAIKSLLDENPDELDSKINQAWLIEPVAGMIEPGEAPEEACHRETLEEAGVSVEARSFEFICQFYPSPGGSSERLHLYAAEVDVTSLPDFSGLVEDHEDIRLVKLDFAEAKRQLLAGEFNVASTIIALQWLFFQKLSKGS